MDRAGFFCVARLPPLGRNSRSLGRRFPVRFPVMSLFPACYFLLFRPVIFRSLFRLRIDFLADFESARPFLQIFTGTLAWSAPLG
jgi:hypothetical protein